MCNFYIMYYTTNDNTALLDDSCWSIPPANVHFPATLPPLPSHSSGEDEESDSHSHVGFQSTQALSWTPTSIPDSPPHDSNSGTPPAPLVPPQSPSSMESDPSSPGSGLVLSEDWPLNGYPIPEVALGQVTAAAFDANGYLHVLHRGPVTWNYE